MLTRLAKLLLWGAYLALCQGCAPQPLTPLEQVEASFAEGQWQATVAGCSELLTTHPGDLNLLSLRGRSYLALGRLDESITDFSLMIEQKPEDPEHYYLRQLAYQRAGYDDLAEADGIHARRMTQSIRQLIPLIPATFRRVFRGSTESHWAKATG